MSSLSPAECRPSRLARKRCLLGVSSFLLLCAWVSAQDTQTTQPAADIPKVQNPQPAQKTSPNEATSPPQGPKQNSSPDGQISPLPGAKTPKISPIEPATNEPSQRQTEIAGRVVGKHGAPMADVSIEATNAITHERFSTLSSLDGRFSMTVPVGHYSISYSQKGFKVKTVEADATAAGATNLKLDIYEPSGQIKVHVSDAKGHGAVAIQVHVSKNDGDSYGGTTDNQGDYVQGALGGGTYTVAATAGVNPCKRITIDDGQRKAVHLKLSEPCRQN